LKEQVMKRYANLSIIVSLFAFATAGALGCQSKQSSEQKFCQSIGSLGNGLKKLTAMAPSASADELRSVTDQIGKDAASAAKAAKHIGSPAAKQLTAAADQFDSDRSKLPKDASFVQVQASLLEDSKQVVQSGHALAQESGCPNAISLAEPTR
jgi:hypothetical protein